MSESLSHVSDAIAETVERVGPSVVRVEARRRLAASGMVWSADGLIITAHHVIEADDAIQVGLSDNRTVSGTLIGRDPTTDIAVIRVEAAGLSPVSRGNIDAARVGHPVLAVGRPGVTVQATLGVVSILGQHWITSGGGQIDRFIQPDVTMNPGFSGGPLIDTAGAALGMNTSALSRSAAVTVPISTLTRVVAALIQHGRISRAYLGIGTQSVELHARDAARLGQPMGLLVVNVAAESPAERFGLILGDIVVAANGTPLRMVEDLLRALSGVGAGADLRLAVIRAGQQAELVVTVGDRPAGRSQ